MLIVASPGHRVADADEGYHRPACRITAERPTKARLACADEVAACDDPQECLDLIDCGQACYDAGGDVDTYPNGFELYGNSLTCLYCTECPNNCSINRTCTN